MLREQLRSTENVDTLPINPFFDVLAFGAFRFDQVTVTSNPPTGIPEACRRGIHEIWVANGSREESKRSIFVLKTASIGVDNRLQLSISQRTFMDHDATRSSEVRAIHQEHAADALGTSIVIVTADDKLVVAQRQSPAEQRGRMGVVSGYPEVTEDERRGKKPDLNAEGNWDPFRTMARETEEEAGIHPDELEDRITTGVIFNKTFNQPIMTFTARCNITSDEIRARKKDGEVAIRFIPATPDAIREIIPLYTTYPSPTGMPSLALFGRMQFGEDWYREVNSELIKEHQRLGQLDPQEREAVRRAGIRDFAEQTSP